MKLFHKGEIILVGLVFAIMLVAVLQWSNGLFSIHVENIIPSEEVAVDVARAIFCARFGDIRSSEPLVAEYNEKNETWFVHGTLPDGYIGGVPEIVLSRHNGRVISIYHGK